MNAVDVGLSLVLSVRVADFRTRRIYGGLYPLFLKRVVKISSSWVRESWSQGALALCIREARTDCFFFDSDVNSGVGGDWYGLASDRICDLGSRRVFCRCQCPRKERVLLYISWLLSFVTLAFNTSSQLEGVLVSFATLSW
jgi:hypothetical protein